jgi:type I restriction enzyme S subunit
MENRFVMYFLNTSSARFQVRKYEQGVTRPRINLGNMKKLVVPNPEVDEQKNICLKLTALEKKIDSEILKRHKLQKQKTGLMHDLLPGKVQVNPAPPETSHVQ